MRIRSWKEQEVECHYSMLLLRQGYARSASMVRSRLCACSGLLAGPACARGFIHTREQADVSSAPESRPSMVLLRLRGTGTVPAWLRVEMLPAGPLAIVQHDRSIVTLQAGQVAREDQARPVSVRRLLVRAGAGWPAGQFEFARRLRPSNVIPLDHHLYIAWIDSQQAADVIRVCLSRPRYRPRATKFPSRSNRGFLSAAATSSCSVAVC